MNVHESETALKSGWIWIFNVDFSSSDHDKVKTLSFIYRGDTDIWPLFDLKMTFDMNLRNSRKTA